MADSVGTDELNAQACELWPTGPKALMDPEAQIPWNRFCKVGLYTKCFYLFVYV